MEQIKEPRIFFTGVGGQGTLTATRILAQAAMEASLDVIAGEVHGMAQRGGVVESTLLLGGWKSPRLDYGEADIILGFEPLESLRALNYLKDQGYIFSCGTCLPPPQVNLQKAKYPDMREIEESLKKKAAGCWFIPCRELGVKGGSIQAGNTALLGALCVSGLLPFGLDMLEKAIATLLPEKIRDSNLESMRLGAEAYQQLARA